MSRKLLLGITILVVCAIFGCQSTPSQPIRLTETFLLTATLPPSSTKFPLKFTNKHPVTTKSPTTVALPIHMETAAPQKTDTWQQSRGFEWCCRDFSAQAEREVFLHHENWASVNSQMGKPYELEYQIAIWSGPLRMADNYLLVSSDPNDEKIAWPPDLDDDVFKPTPGGLPMQLFFSFDKWARIGL